MEPSEEDLIQFRILLQSGNERAKDALQRYESTNDKEKFYKAILDLMVTSAERSDTTHELKNSSVDVAAAGLRSLSLQSESGEFTKLSLQDMNNGPLGFGLDVLSAAFGGSGGSGSSGNSGLNSSDGAFSLLSKHTSIENVPSFEPFGSSPLFGGSSENSLQQETSRLLGLRSNDAIGFEIQEMTRSKYQRRLDMHNTNSSTSLCTQITQQGELSGWTPRGI